MTNYTVYQITNTINNNIYIGVHITENINDKYFGSGTNIIKAIKEFGKEKFEKTILYNCNSKKQMLEKEKELVNEKFINRTDTYNIILGGGEIYTEGKVNVIDKNGITSCICINDTRYLSGELVSVNKGFFVVKNDNNEYIRINKTDPRYLSGEFKSTFYNKVVVKDINNIRFVIDKNDIRYLSGELVGITKGMKMPPTTEETKNKIRLANIGNKNSQYNTCWVYNLQLLLNKKIKIDDLQNYINNGWVKGRKMSF